MYCCLIQFDANADLSLLVKYSLCKDVIDIDVFKNETRLHFIITNFVYTHLRSQKTDRKSYKYRHNKTFCKAFASGSSIRHNHKFSYLKMDTIRREIDILINLACITTLLTELANIEETQLQIMQDISTVYHRCQEVSQVDRLTFESCFRLIQTQGRRLQERATQLANTVVETFLHPGAGGALIHGAADNPQYVQATECLNRLRRFKFDHPVTVCVCFYETHLARNAN